MKICKENKEMTELWESKVIPPRVSFPSAGRLGYGRKMSDLVVAVLQLARCSSWDDPAEPLAVWSGALGVGVFDQAFPDQLSNAQQVSISHLNQKSVRKTTAET